MEKTNCKLPQVLDNPELLTRDEVAQLLHVSLSYVDHLNDLPCYRLGRKKLFNKSEILEYLNRNYSSPISHNISKTEIINRTKEDANE